MVIPRTRPAATPRWRPPCRRGGHGGRRVEPGGGLVEEDQVGVADDAERQVQAAALAAGERLDAGVALLAQTHQVDDLVGVARVRKPSRISTVVVLPAPLGPSSAKHSPSAISKVIPVTASTSP
jgi:hypothetical protein